MTKLSRGSPSVGGFVTAITMRSAAANPSEGVARTRAGRRAAATPSVLRIDRCTNASLKVATEGISRLVASERGDTLRKYHASQKGLCARAVSEEAWNVRGQAKRLTFQDNGRMEEGLFGSGGNRRASIFEASGTPISSDGPFLQRVELCQVLPILGKSRVPRLTSAGVADRRAQAPRRRPRRLKYEAVTLVLCYTRKVEFGSAARRRTIGLVARGARRGRARRRPVGRRAGSRSWLLANEGYPILDGAAAHIGPTLETWSPIPGTSTALPTDSPSTCG